MKSLSVFGLLCAALIAIAPSQGHAAMLGNDADLCEGGHGPAIQVNILGLKDRAGEVWLELYPAAESDFLRPDTDLIAEGKTFRRLKAHVPANGPVSVCLRAPGAGRFALMLRHNRTGKDKFSFWNDGAGVAANQAFGRSKPTLQQAAVNVGPAVTVVNIKVQYLRGFGFAPLAG